MVFAGHPPPSSSNCIAHHRSSDGTDQSVQEHLRGVADLSERFAAKIGMAKAGRLIGLVHDLGKYSNKFQNYLRSGVGLINPDEDAYVDFGAAKGKIDHSTAGAQVIWRELSKNGPLERLTGQLLALAVASHHSGLIDCLAPDGTDNFQRRMGKDDHLSHMTESWGAAEANLRTEIETLLKDPALVASCKGTVAGIIRNHVVSEPFYDTVNTFKFGLLARMLFSCLIDADRIDTADFENPRAAELRQHGRYTSWDKLAERLEIYLRQFSSRTPVDAVRQEVSEACLKRAQAAQGVFTLTVPTGGGKTLASLRFALAHAAKHRLDRILYIVPFTSIIDQNAQVVRNILEDEGGPLGSVVLEHHSNLTPEEQSWRAKILSESWDAPVVFTTSVQFLESLFSGGTRGARRLHQLANSVIIFDEIQTLPVRCVHLFCNALNFLVESCRTTAVLCTATQPLLGDLKHPEKGVLKLGHLNEIIPDVPNLFQKLKRVEVRDFRKTGGWTDEEIAELATRQVAETGSCLVVVNTKASAQTLYSLIKKRGVFTTFHLSTTMCPAHRMDVLAEVRAKLGNEPLACISTQLIEAGVDVDFASVIRFLAGLDSVAQAAGRCNRNGRRQIGFTYLVNPTNENLDPLRDIKIGKENTERVLTELEGSPVSTKQDILAPEILRRFFGYYFFDRAEEMVYPVSAQREAVGREDSLLELLSTNSLTPVKFEGTPVIRHAFASAARVFSAIDAPSQGVVVPYGQAGAALIGELAGAFELGKQFNLLRRAQRYSVNVFPNILKRLHEHGAVYELQSEAGIFALDERYYSSETGLTTEAQKSLDLALV